MREYRIPKRLSTKLAVVFSVLVVIVAVVTLLSFLRINKRAEVTILNPDYKVRVLAFTKGKQHDYPSGFSKNIHRLLRVLKLPVNTFDPISVTTSLESELCWVSVRFKGKPTLSSARFLTLKNAAIFRGRPLRDPPRGNVPESFHTKLREVEIQVEGEPVARIKLR